MPSTNSTRSLLAAFACCAAVCFAAHRPHAALAQPTSSPVVGPTRQALEAELAVVVDEMLRIDPNAADAPSTQPLDAAGSPRDRLLAQGQALLDAPTSPVLPVDWPTLDDGGAARLVNRLEQVFRDFKLELSPIVQTLRTQNQSAPLAGTRLQLLARLMYGELDVLTRATQGPTTRR